VSDLVDEFTAQIALILPYVGAVFGGIIGLVALVALGYFVINRVRGAIR